MKSARPPLRSRFRSREHDDAATRLAGLRHVHGDDCQCGHGHAEHMHAHAHARKAEQKQRLPKPPAILSEKCAEIYVSMDGDDSHGGTELAPLQTLSRAMELIDDTREDAEVKIFLGSGIHLVDAPIMITPSKRKITVASWPGQRARIAGWRMLQCEWKPHEGGTWKAEIGAGLSIDTLYANGERQVLCRYPKLNPDATLGGVAADALSPERVAKWKNPEGGYIRALHEAAWGGNSYVITGKDADGRLQYRWAGNNNRGSKMSEKNVLVENVFEELSAENEWFYDPREGSLYYIPQGDADPNEMNFAYAAMPQLISLIGFSPDIPVANVSFKEIDFSGTSRTMFSIPHERPLRSDWAIQRAGAVFMENAANISFDDCAFYDIGGNALMISGFNRDIDVNHCEFFDVGATGVMIAGKVDAVRDPSFWDGDASRTEISDADPGPKSESYPRSISVRNCYFTECGTLEKQSAGVCISIASRVTVSKSTIHRMPRGGISVNDGCFGGHLIEDNDIFDCVRETGDHGPFNSWGRDRYWSLGGLDPMGGNGEEKRKFALLDAVETTVIRHNRIHALHAFGIDLDDGSTNYEICDNLCLGAGIKTREGFDRIVHNNIQIGCPFEVHVSFARNDDKFFSNIVVNSKPFNFIMPHDGHTTEIRDNVYWNLGKPLAQISEAERAGGIVADPQFMNADGNDYAVPENSEACKRGFKNFPMGDKDFGRPDCPKPPTFRYFASEENCATRMIRGATVSEIASDGLQSAVGLPDHDGVIILDLPFDAAFSHYGFEKMDVIRAINGAPTPNIAALESALAALNPGVPATAAIHRNPALVTIPFIP